MYKLSTAPSIRFVTPKEAEQEFLAINNFPGQRDYRPEKGRQYADGMADGSFRIPPIDIATSPSGVKYLMNGQHTCHGIFLHGKPVKCIVSHYTCDTDEDLWRLFATFDVHATRTQGQIFKGARPFFKDERLRDLPLRILTACGSALLILGDGNRKPHFGNHSLLNKTPKVEACDQHADDVVWVNGFSSQHPHLQRVGVIAAMIATFRARPDTATEFWKLVADGIGIKSKESPAYRLREKLIHESWGASANTRSGHFIAYSTCVSWWNCYVTGEKRLSVKVAAMKEPPAVAGKITELPLRDSTRSELNGKHKRASLGSLVATAR